MEEKNKQILKYYPSSITMEKTNIIMDQMKKYIFKIKNKNGEGTGFFCYIFNNNIKIPVLITNSHIIDENFIKQNKILNIILNDGREYKSIELQENKKIYTNKKYDITIIDISPEKDNIINFLELDELIFLNQNIFNDPIYIINYPKSGNECKVSVSYGIIEQINSEINIFNSKDLDWSGAPILRLSNNKIIGIYNENINLSILNMKNAINEYLSNINLIKVEYHNFYINKTNQIPQIINTILGPEIEENEEGKNNKSEINSKTVIGPETEEKEYINQYNDEIPSLNIKKNNSEILNNNDRYNSNINNDNINNQNIGQAKFILNSNNIQNQNTPNIDFNGNLNINNELNNNSNISNNPDNFNNYNINEQNMNNMNINMNIYNFNECMDNRLTFSYDQINQKEDNNNTYMNNNNNTYNNNNFNTPNKNIKNLKSQNCSNRGRYKSLSNAKSQEINNINLNQGYSFSRIRKVPKLGLKNSGNTSNFNSVYQLLGNFQDLADFFLDSNNQLNINSNINTMRLSYLIQRLFIHLYPIQEKKEEIYEPIYQTDFIVKNNIQLEPNFLICFILNTLDNELNKLKNNNQLLNYNIYDRNNVIDYGIKNFKNSNNSIISTMIYYFGVKESRCSICNHITYDFLIYNIMDLDILNTYNFFNKNNVKTINIYNCLAYKRIIKQEKWFCNNCRQINIKYNKYEIYDSPEILIFTLNRGNFNRNLINVPFLLESEIHLNGFVEKMDAIKDYELTGIVSIYMEKKKYVCCYKSYIDKNWYFFNDEIVLKADFNMVMKNHNNKQFIPLILVYEEIKK